MASSLMHIIMNYLKISRKPPCFVTVYITADYLYTEPNTSNERSQFITNRNLSMSYYFPSNPQLSSSASFLRLNVLSSLN